MILNYKIKLLPNNEQLAYLLKTMERFNEACDFVAAIAFSIRSANKMRLQKEIYYELRERYDLPAQLAIRVIAKVCEAFKLDKTRRPRFDKHSAVVYDQRVLSWKGPDRVSLVTLHGRTIMPFISCDYYESRKGVFRG